MRDPYEILGVPRGASFEEIRAAYRRASKTRHPDMGGSHEQMVELNTAYARILDELKRGAQSGARRASEEPRARQSEGRSNAPPHEEEFADAGARWRASAADIDEELDNLRRASETLDERLRAMRQEAWREGEKIVWAKLTWDNLVRFFVNLARSGIKGLATLFAALIGVGSILVEANFISALVILGSGIGLFLSLALKSDKGGFMSAGLLMFGLATMWLPPVRAALFGWPLATISVLVCLGLIFKFAHEGGVAGLMTGGVLALFIIGAIVDDPLREQQAAQNAPIRQPAQSSAPAPAAPPPAAQSGTSQQRMPTGPTVIARAPPPQPPPAPAVRELRAAQGSVLKFVSGVPYQLKVRAGLTTVIDVVSGTIASYNAGSRVGDCVTTLQFTVVAAPSSYQDVDRLIQACGGDAVAQVSTH